MTPQLYRKRLMPDEIVKLKNDEIVYAKDGIIVTNWKPIKPRTDIGRGESCYLIDRGVKISRFYDADFKFTYWYCDIISTSFDERENKYVFTDLLADVVIYADGFVKILDLDELTDALDSGIISIDTMKDCLKKLSWLLDIVYAGKIDELCGNYLNMALKLCS